MQLCPSALESQALFGDTKRKHFPKHAFKKSNMGKISVVEMKIVIFNNKISA